jgi:cell division protein FtsB
MKNKIIAILTSIIILLLLIFQTYRAKIVKKENEKLYSQIKSLELTIEINNNDLQKRNEELEEKSKVLQLYKKRVSQINDKCLNSVVNAEFAHLLYNNKEL